MHNEILEVLKQIQGDINELKTDVISLKTDVGSLKTDVGSLKTDVSSLKTDVSSLKNGQERIEDKVDKIYTYLEEIDAKQATNHLEVTNKFTETNTKIDSVQFDVNNLATKVYTSDNKIIEIDRKLNIVK